MNDIDRAIYAAKCNAQAARIKALETALEPFAGLCNWLADEYSGPGECADEDVLLVTDWEVPPEDRHQITAGMIRDARAALRKQGAGEEE